MAVNTFECPKCGTQHNWEKFPPLYCTKCRAVFDIKRAPQTKNESISTQDIPRKQEFCTNCGIQFKRESNFCPGCGIRLKKPTYITTSDSEDVPYKKNESSVQGLKKEDIITIFDVNAFRILGTEGNVTRKVLRNIQQSSKARAKLGGILKNSDPLGFLNTPPRDEKTIRNAINQIETSKTRILERIFWFINFNQTDAEALNKLKAGAYNEAVPIWKNSDDLSASINLAILYHAYYLSNDLNLQKNDKWQRVFDRWKDLVNNDKYWALYEEIENSSGFEPLATRDDFDILKNTIWKHLLQPNIDCMKKARDTNLDDLVKCHLELIHSINLPAKLVSEIECDVFSPLEIKIIEDIEGIGKSIIENKESARSKIERKEELDRLLDVFKKETLPKIHRLMKISGNNSAFSTSILEKSAICLREISISYHNDVEDFELSEKVLHEAKKFADGTPVLLKINEDLSIISDHAKNVRELEKFVEYNDTIGSHKLVITKDLIVYQKRRIWVKDITGIKYGISLSSINGIPTERSYAIWLKTGEPIQQNISSNGYIPPVNQDVMLIECAHSTWFGEAEIRSRFDNIVDRLFHLVQVPFVNKMIADFQCGKRCYISNIAIDFTGIYKDFSYDPITKGLISVSSKFLGTKDVITKEGKGKHLSWDNYQGYNFSDGRLWIFGDSTHWASFSLRDDWNAVNLGLFLQYLGEEDNLVRDIESCISGSGAVGDEKSEIINTLELSLETDPNNWLTWWQKGRALRNLGRFEEAVNAFDRVIILKPQDPEVLNVKGLTLLNIQKENEALECFKRAIVMDSQRPHFWFNMGMTYERLKKYEEAVRTLDRGLAINFDQDIKNTRDEIQSRI